MKALVKERLSDGVWVRGKTLDDEKFHGFIESQDKDKGIAKIQVTASDNEIIIGRTISSPIASLTSLPEGLLTEEGDLYNFIDIALSTKDKPWFMELTSQLKAAARQSPNLKPQALKA